MAVRQASDTKLPHGEFTLTSGGAYTINTQSAWHGFTGMSEDESQGVNVHAGAIGTDISAYATNDGGASTKVTTTGAHGLSTNDYITITNTTNYNDVYQVIDVVDSTNFVIDKAWDTNDDGVGTYAHADHFQILKDGTYLVTFTASGTSAVGAQTALYGIFCNKTLDHQVERKFSNATDVGAWSLTALVNVSTGDEIWIGVQNEDNTNNFTISDCAFTCTRIHN